MRYQLTIRLQAAILDCAGAVADFGIFDIEVSLEKACGPVGIVKRDHIRTRCNQRAIAQRFHHRFGRTPNDTDISEIYKRFMPLQIAKVGEYSTLIPGALGSIAALREAGLKIGSTSGYPKEVLDKLVPLASAAGYSPDYVVATNEVPKGSPSPAQVSAKVIALGVDDVAACVKVDDTQPGILEGRSAGMWTVALRFSGNFLGLMYDEYRAFSSERLGSERKCIDNLFVASEPSYLIDSITELPSIVIDINARLTRGESPAN